MEQDLIKKIRGAMLGIKTKSKTPKDSNIAIYLNKLKDVNKGQYEGLLAEYKQLLIDIKKKI